jgi:hypothetical protein
MDAVARATPVATAALITYTVAVFMWLNVVGYGVMLENHPRDGRFASAIDWPAGPAALGTAWTILVVLAALTSVRAPRGQATWCLAATTGCGIAFRGLVGLIPGWFDGMGIVGLSAGEYVEVFLFGGVLPGEQGTLLLTGICIALAAATAIRALR